MPGLQMGDLFRDVWPLLLVAGAAGFLLGGFIVAMLWDG